MVTNCHQLKDKLNDENGFSLEKKKEFTSALKEVKDKGTKIKSIKDILYG